MPLIVNSKQLPDNATKDNELFKFVKEYQDGVSELKLRFLAGDICLRRNGYPRINKSPDGTRINESPAPIYIKLTRSVNGATWGYCKGRALIHPNGLVEVPPNESYEDIGSEYIHINLSVQPDYAFFMMYKSGILGTEYTVYDPEGDRMKELREKNARMLVTSAIWTGMDDAKLRMMSQAWGIAKAGEKDILILKEEIEKKVFQMEDEKQKNPTDLMLRGIEHFLADSRSDEFTRPKALIQAGIDDKRITYDRNHYYFDGEDLCHVPFGRDNPAERQEFLAQFCRNPENKEKWLLILKGLLNKDYIETMDKYGCRYFAGQFDLPLNQKEDALKTALLSEFA